MNKIAGNSNNRYFYWEVFSEKKDAHKLLTASSFHSESNKLYKISNWIILII